LSVFTGGGRADEVEDDDEDDETEFLRLWADDSVSLIFFLIIGKK